jgi:hypothetical protein
LVTESPPTSINLERAAHKKLHTLEESKILDNRSLCLWWNRLSESFGFVSHKLFPRYIFFNIIFR